MSVEPLRKYPEILGDIEAKLRLLLGRYGIGESVAHEISLEATEHIRAHWGGQKIYIARGVSYNRQRLKEAIFTRWNSHNTPDLCREFCITETYLRRLYDEARKEHAASRQPQLF